MPIESVLKLIIAICRILEVQPTELVEAFLQDEQNQEYYNLLLNLQARAE